MFAFNLLPSFFSFNLKIALIGLACTSVLLDSTAQTPGFVQKLVADDRNAGDQFGGRVGASNDFMIVGASQQDFDDDGNNLLENAGAAYIFKKDIAGGWYQYQKIVASDRASEDQFGWRVAIHNNMAIVSSPNSDTDENLENSIQDAGAVYVFQLLETGQWEEIQKITASDRFPGDKFGNSLLFKEGTLMIGSLSSFVGDGEFLSLNSGAAYVFEYDEMAGEWIESQKLVASDRNQNDYFSYDMDLHGNYAVLSAAFEDNGVTNDTIMGSGSAYVFERISNGEWIEVQKLEASDRAEGDTFGFKVEMFGDYIVSSSVYKDEETSNDILENAGATYIFKKDAENSWEEVQKITSSDLEEGDYFGHSLNLDGDILLVGAISESHDSNGENYLENSGSVYQFELDNLENWNETEKITAPIRHESADFGIDVFQNASDKVIGALWDPFDENDENYLASAGAVFAYGTCHNPFGGVIIDAIDNNLFSVNESENAEYQWVDCNNNFEPIEGETNSSFNAPNGSFALIVTTQVCSDTSECLLTTMGVADMETASKFEVYPNPFQSEVKIKLDKRYSSVFYALRDISGKLILENQLGSGSEFTIDTMLKPGVYLLEIRSNTELLGSKKLLRI